MTFRKAEYIKDFACKVLSGEFDIESLPDKSDDELIARLSALKGIGVWTAEMIMTFCMQRPDIFSFGDLAIHRGLRMLYHHKNVDKKLFEKYRRRYSPYGTVASLYIWAIAAEPFPKCRIML
jgi:DNA-3-methyladenine glycosylase II